MSGEVEDDEDDIDISLSDEGMDDFDDDETVDAEADEEMSLDPRERAARALEIRRGIEARQEERRLSEDLDYLEFDDD